MEHKKCTRFKEMNTIDKPHYYLGFTLLELLMIAAITAVIAAFSIPSYRNYVTKTKVNALWHQAEAAKLAVESKYLKLDTAVNDITVNSGAAEYTTSNTNFVKCITIQNGTVSVVGDPTKFNGKEIWISWTPTVGAGSINWSCNYSNDTVPYVADTSDTCAVTSCAQYSSWSTPATVNSQTFWYFGNLTQADVSTAFANNCRTSGTMSGCNSCFNFSSSDTEQRFMEFDLSNFTHNYAGALGSDPDWSSHTSWTYQYEYTVVTQSCMAQTRTAGSCSVTEPFASDAACN